MDVDFNVEATALCHNVPIIVPQNVLDIMHMEVNIFYLINKFMFTTPIEGEDKPT